MADKSIGDLVMELEAARVRLKDTTDKESQARNERTTALNHYNDICKKIEAAIADVKDTAPSETDWGRRKP
jgi:hypothetical protein